MSDHLFPVDIEDTRTVGHLKKEILKEKRTAFAKVDPDELTLWKVCGFLRFDQVSYILVPSSLRIPLRSTGAQGECDPTPVPRPQCVVRGGYIVGNISSFWTRPENSPHRCTSPNPRMIIIFGTVNDQRQKQAVYKSQTLGIAWF